MTRNEIIDKIEELEELLYQTDEEQEELEEYRKTASKGSKMLKIYIEEFQKEGLSEDLALELLKISLGANKQ